jgi:hypothetical protein
MGKASTGSMYQEHHGKYWEDIDMLVNSKEPKGQVDIDTKKPLKTAGWKKTDMAGNRGKKNRGYGPILALQHCWKQIPY